MKIDAKYCFLAFGELALDITYNETGIINEVGGVSAFNALYNLSVFGEETYAIGGVGNDSNAIKAIESLKKASVNTSYIKMIDKKTNVFYIYAPRKMLYNNEDVEISNKSPFTGKSSITWSDKIPTDFPEELENRKVILIVSNFEKVTMEFIKKAKLKCNDCIVSLDITNGKIFEKYSKEYLWEYLKQIDLLQCNENTFQAVCKKLNIFSFHQLFSQLKLQIFTITRGSKGAIFVYKNSNGENVCLDKKPRIVAPLIDTTGAGDAFHSMMLLSYHRLLNNHEKFDETFLNNSFEIANALARKVVQINGARGEPDILRKYMLKELNEKIKKYNKNMREEEVYEFFDTI